MSDYWKATKRTEADIKRALERNEWDVGLASRELGYNRPTFLWKRLQRYPEMLEEVNKHKQVKVNRRKTYRSNAEYRDAIAKSKGVKSVIAEMLGLSIATVYQRLKNNPELKEALDNEAEGFKDVAELKLFELVEQGNFNAIKFYLTTQARERGYSDRFDLTATFNVNKTFNLELLGDEELLLLEGIYKKGLQAPEGDIIDGTVINSEEG